MLTIIYKAAFHCIEWYAISAKRLNVDKLRNLKRVTVEQKVNRVRYQLSQFSIRLRFLWLYVCSKNNRLERTKGIAYVPGDIF